ncbi:MAG TPA: hypothetical protein EYP10_09740 [Armatimonadetes bacterium]|nr:hypothetical protein [Armatimonadota bacterium]
MSIRPTLGYGAEIDDALWERVRAAFSFEEADRVPIWDYIDNANVVERFKHPTDDYDTAMARTYHALGIDLCRGYGRSFSESDEGKVINGESVAWKVSGRTAWVTRYPIQSIKQLREFQPDPIDEETIRRNWVPSVRTAQQRFAPYTLFVPGGGCGFHATYGLMGQVLFSYAIYDAPNALLRVMEVMNENAVRYARIVAQEQLAPIYFIGDDIAYKDKLMFSPDFLRRTFIPCLKRTIEPLKEANIWVVFHSDGCLWEIMDDLLDAGIDGLNPIEPLAGMDLASLKRKYGKRLVLVGGIDCSQLLPLGTKEDIERAVKEAMRIAAPGGGFIIGSSSEIVPATPVENVLAFYEACHKYGRYPIRQV